MGGFFMVLLGFFILTALVGVGWAFGIIVAIAVFVLVFGVKAKKP